MIETIPLPCQWRGCGATIRVTTKDEYVKKYCPRHYKEAHDDIIGFPHPEKLTLGADLFLTLWEENYFYEGEE